jgi:hypothetical protein
MGLLKKITRPISRVLDKIVPNEIKPALPFLAAAAPFMAPGIMGIGGNTMLSRALISGGLNLGSQLAQEGSEGDFSPLSVALASGIGALSAPNAASTIRGVDPNFVGPRPAPEGILGQGKEFLAKSAEFLGPQTGGAVDILGKGGTQAGLNLETARAAMVPFTQATTDLAVADARRLEKQAAIDEALAQAELLEDSGARAAAIRQFMEAAGYFSEDEIAETISAAGYANGGRVGLSNGGEPGIMGNPAVMEKIENMREFMIANPDIVDITDYSEKYESKDPDFEGIKGAVKKINKDEMLEVDAYSTLLKNVDAVYEKVGIPSSILQEHSDWESEKLNMFDTMSEYKSWLNTNYPKSPIGTYLYHLPKEEKMDIVEKISIKKALGGRVGAEEGGLMNLGGKEMDLRKGGFVPIGKKERADDVPARLSKNEFVMTADAVRGAGGGDINKGAKRMYETMNRLEARA